MDFAPFDRRRYPTLPVREGYGEWAQTCEDVVQDEMDLRLLARIESVDWARPGGWLDLACGTGRIGAWLRGQGVQHLDGLDFTPEMLARAEAKGVYDRLIQADALDTGLPGRRTIWCSRAWPTSTSRTSGRCTGRPRGSPGRRASSSSSATIRTSS